MTGHDVQTLWREIMNQATLSLWTQRNVALSWPVPSQDGAQQLNFFTYTASQVQPGVERIGKPDIRIIWHGEYSLAMQAGKGFTGVGGLFPYEHASQWGDPLTRPFLMEELTSLYNAALAFYPHHMPPAIFRERLCALWSQFVPPCLVPFHEALNPGFFAWMRGATLQ